MVNRNTGIETRAVIRSSSDPFWNPTYSPSISDLDEIFRKDGVDLATAACRKALEEWNGAVEDITHTVAVTCTNTSNPGFDLLVAKNLNLRPDVDRTLLHGVGCAGGLAAMRVAANIACGATQRRKAARILVFACELCSIHLRCDLDAITQAGGTFNVASIIFSDGAAAFVLCNELGLAGGMKSLQYSLLDWKTAVLPDTQQYMSFLACASGASMISFTLIGGCELTLKQDSKVPSQRKCLT